MRRPLGIRGDRDVAVDLHPTSPPEVTCAEADALFVAACLVSPRRRFWATPRGIALNAARIFVIRELVWVAKEIQAL
jgi:hypothetical protein